MLIAKLKVNTGVTRMPMTVALGTQLFESWVHRQDIVHGRGEIDREGPFSVLLPTAFFGITKLRNYEPLAPVSIDFNGHGTFTLQPGIGFERGASPQAEATVKISADEFVLIAVGRLDADSANATITGKHGLGMELLYSIRYTGLTPGL